MGAGVWGVGAHVGHGAREPAGGGSGGPVLASLLLADLRLVTG